MGPRCCYVFAPSHACACASPGSWELWRFSRTLPWQGPRCCYVFAPSHACACASPNSWEFGCFFVTKFTLTSTMQNPNRDGGMSPGKRPGPNGPPGALHQPSLMLRPTLTLTPKDPSSGTLLLRLPPPDTRG